MTRPALAEVRDLRFRWPDGPMLFAGATFEVPTGVTWIGGDESTGKTTLLRLLAADLVPLGGSIQTQGTVFWIDPRHDGCDTLTPEQCFDRVAARHAGLDRAMLAELVMELGVAPHLGKRLDMLSTGSRRKVWLAAAFASGAALTLLDQPFAALDKASVGLVTELLQEAAAHPSRGWVVADYEAPRGVRLAARLELNAAW